MACRSGDRGYAAELHEVAGLPPTRHIDVCPDTDRENLEPLVARGTGMIEDPAQRRVTKAHLEQFQAALTNLMAGPATKPAKHRRLEIDAVQAKIDDFRRDLAE